MGRACERQDGASDGESLEPSIDSRRHCAYGGRRVWRARPIARVRSCGWSLWRQPRKKEGPAPAPWTLETYNKNNLTQQHVVDVVEERSARTQSQKVSLFSVRSCPRTQEPAHKHTKLESCVFVGSWEEHRPQSLQTSRRPQRTGIRPQRGYRDVHGTTVQLYAVCGVCVEHGVEARARL